MEEALIQQDDDRLRGLLELLDKAFSGVRLEDGIGLLEGDAVDEGKPKKDRDAARAADEREDWRLITGEDLSRHYWCITRLDGKGMRFLMPAFLRAILKGEFEFMLVPLAYSSRIDVFYAGDQFSLFDESQKAAVRQVLLFIHPFQSETDQNAIHWSLRNIWS